MINRLGFWRRHATGGAVGNIIEREGHIDGPILS